MNQFHTRPVTPADASAVNDLLAAAEAVDHTDEHYDVEDVLEELANPMIDLGRDWVVVEHCGRVVAHARLLPRAPDEGSVSITLDGTVHPEHRGQGIGSRLVPLMVDRARAYARERDLTPVVTGGALTTNTDAADIFGRHGLRPHRWTFVMEVALSGPPSEPPALPEGYSLSTWEGVGPDELRAAHNRAFVDHPDFTPWSASMWNQWVAGSRTFRPALSLLARDEWGGIASYIQTSEFEAVAEATGIRDAFLAKVGTVEGHRRKGLAGVLLRIALERYREHGFDRASLEVDSENPTGALGIYERAGFRTSIRWTSYRLEEPPPGSAGR